MQINKKRSQKIMGGNKDKKKKEKKKKPVPQPKKKVQNK